MQLLPFKKALLPTLVAGFLLSSVSGCQSTAALQETPSQQNVSFQLLNNDANQPSMSQTAKNRLMIGLHRHLDGGYSAVSQNKYSFESIVDDNSVDAGSQSVFMTVLEAIGYMRSGSGLDNYDIYDSNRPEWIIEVKEQVEEYKQESKDSQDRFANVPESWASKGFEPKSSEGAMSEEKRASLEEKLAENRRVNSDKTTEEIETLDSKLEAVEEKLARLSKVISDEEPAITSTEKMESLTERLEAFTFEDKTTEEIGISEEKLASIRKKLLVYPMKQTSDQTKEYSEAALEAEDYDYDDVYEPDVYEEDSRRTDKFFGLLDAYKAMKQEQARNQERAEDEDVSDNLDFFNNFLSKLLSSPEQIDAFQTYMADNATINSVSRYSRNAKTYQNVMSYDLNSPTQQVSIQVPYQIDFKNESVSFDYDAALPIMALLMPEYTPLPQDIESNTVEFFLPDSIKEKVPSDVIFDAFIVGVERAFNELDSEYYTAVDISEDNFAQQMNAVKGIKLYLGAKETGEFVGKIIKSMGNDLKVYIDNDVNTVNEEEAWLKEAVDQWALYNTDFQSKDVGGLLQIVEAIAPINFYTVNYYYLDAQNNLIGKQSKQSMSSELYGRRINSVTQSRYDAQSVNRSPLNRLLQQDFGQLGSSSINGNEWLAEISKENGLYDLAVAARSSYEYDDIEEDSLIPLAEKDKQDETEVEDDDINNYVIDNAEPVVLLEEETSLRNNDSDVNGSSMDSDVNNTSENNVTSMIDDELSKSVEGMDIPAEAKY